MSTQETVELERLGEEAKTEIASREDAVGKMPFAQALVTLAKYLPAKKLTTKESEEVRRALSDQPDVWTVAGDMALQAEQQMIGKMISQPAAQETIRFGIRAMRKKLGSEDGPLLEKLLIDQIILCWLNLNSVELRYNNAMADALTLTVGAYWEKRLTAAQGRYLRAIETLARVRRLSKATPLQVNIGGQQVNIAGTPNQA